MDGPKGFEVLTRAHAVVLIAALLLVLADIQYFLAVVHGNWIAGPVLSMAGWMMAFTLIGAAAGRAGPGDHRGVLMRSGAHAELTLAYLRDLPIDILKIDKSFMPADPTDAHQIALVRAVVDLARSLQLITVAEGVEEAHHADLLRALGCDRGQGWLFGRPAPAPAATTRLSSEAAITVG